MQRTALIVDDHELTVELLARRLQALGFDTLTGSDGHAALALAACHHPDLIILDVMMPGLSGFDVVRELKSRPETCAIPVLLLTAMNQADDAARGRAAGADGFLRKPFGKEDFRQAVAALFQP